MDFASRLKDHGVVSAELAIRFGMFAGVDANDLRWWVLPALKQIGAVDYAYEDASLLYVEESIGVGAPILYQLGDLLEAMQPTDVERCLLCSVALGSWAPLVERQHLDYLVGAGFSEENAIKALQLSRSIGINKEIDSQRLRDRVVYNAYVWGSNIVEMAGFLRNLPSVERDLILGLCEDAAERPGLALPGMSAYNPNLIISARKVGLIQAARVVSSRLASSEQTYIFSPLMDLEDNHLRTTEALNRRKIFLAHILYGHEKADRAGGRIVDPVLLVSALLRNGRVGPASNISTDYQLLETHGIVRVSGTGSEAVMHVVQDEIIRDSLNILERTMGEAQSGTTSYTPLESLRPPGIFISPERDRLLLPDEAATSEVTEAAVLRLREEAQRAARNEDPFR